MKRLINGLLFIVCLTLTGCATQTRARLSGEFDQSVKAYNRMLRWQEIEKAVVIYVDTEQQEESLKQAETLKKRGLSVTDFRILSSRYHPDKQSGDVVAEFDYYILPSNRIKTVSYRQEWVYREDIKGWKLRSRLPTFE